MRKEMSEPSNSEFGRKVKTKAAIVLLAATTYFGFAKPVEGKPLRDKTVEPGINPEKQEVSDFFPVLTVNLGNKDVYKIEKVEDLSNPESAAYKSISENASYKEFVEKSFVFADIATKLTNKKFNVRPAFAITPDNNVLVSSLLLHQDEKGLADDYFLFGWEKDKTPIMQRITLQDTQKGKIDIQIRPLKLGNETIMTPTITDLTTGEALNFIGNPFKDNGPKPTPAPQNDGGIKDLKLVSYKVDKDNKLEIENLSIPETPGFSLMSKDELAREKMTSGLEMEINEHSIKIVTNIPNLSIIGVEKNKMIYTLQKAGIPILGNKTFRLLNLDEVKNKAELTKKAHYSSLGDNNEIWDSYLQPIPDPNNGANFTYDIYISSKMLNNFNKIGKNGIDGRKYYISKVIILASLKSIIMNGSVNAKFNDLYDSKQIDLPYFMDADFGIPPTIMNKK